MSEIFPVLLLLGIVLLGIVLSSEVFAPGLIQEGFSNIDTSFWSSYANPRDDIGPRSEEKGYIRDPRYFNDYTDVSRIGVNYDFCRVVAREEDPDNQFLACALASTDSLTSVSFRTQGTKEGFKLSYDDYMRDINNDGRAEYCRILPYKGAWQAMCVRSTDFGFDPNEVGDRSPPDDISMLLTFYDGCVLWLRFENSMIDFIKNTTVSTAGAITINESVDSPTVGLSFNGARQYLRISDSSNLSFGNLVPLRSIRCVMVWVKFDAFTNNAKIFDFGNGKGKDNVFLGILGKGESEELKPSMCESTVPTGPSGAQPVLEMSPQRLMETTNANVNEYICGGFEPDAKKEVPAIVNATANVKEKATLLYEVWDKEQRKMRIKINAVIPLKEWVHICVTATNNDAFRPNMAVYVNGKQVYIKENGFLPSTNIMESCYIGKSNWANSVSQYENRDELFNGTIFDFRMYKTMLDETMILDSYDWGKKKLGLSRDGI